MFKALEEFICKADRGPYIGPRGGKWADPEHTIPWREISGERTGGTLEDKIKRRERGKGTQVDLTKSELKWVLKHGTYGLISAGKNPKLEPNMTEAEQIKRHEKLRGDLKAGGYVYTEVVGHYEGAEKSFLVLAHNISKDSVIELGRKYNQDSVIHVDYGKNVMAFTAGENKGKYHEGAGYEIKDNATDYYTVIKHPPPEGETKFALNFDWGTMKKAKELTDMEKSYTAIRNAYEKKYGSGSWEKIKISKESKDSNAKAEKLPFGSKKKLGPEEHERYTKAKKRLARTLGMPTSGWGLYGRTIVGALKNKDEKKGTEKSMSGIDELKEFVKAGGPYIGPKGGKWADPKHTVSWKEETGTGAKGKSVLEKPQYDEDFKAGFKEGQAAYAKDKNIDKKDADSAYEHVSKKHGSYFVDGYTAAIDHGRGAHEMANVKLAHKMGLVSETPGQKEPKIKKKNPPDTAFPFKDVREAVERKDADSAIKHSHNLAEQLAQHIHNRTQQKYGADAQSKLGDWKHTSHLEEAWSHREKAKEETDPEKKAIHEKIAEHHWEQAKKHLPEGWSMPETKDTRKSMSGIEELEQFAKAEVSKDAMRKKLIMFFERNPNPPDSKLHNWAENNGWNPHDVETEIYTLATEYAQFLNDGRAKKKGVQESDVNAMELKAGIKVESEHTPNKESAKRIALDHLAEMPDYYTQLKAMENKATKKSLEDTDMKKAELPTGTPTIGGSGAEQGGKLEEAGKVSGSINSSAGEPVGAPKSETKKLSEDDEDVEQQMKPGKKPIETLKSTTPQGQRESVAHEHAVAVSKRLKDAGEDVEVGVGVKPPVKAPKQLEKSMEWNQGADSMVTYSNRADMEATALLKSDSFYINESPSIGKQPLLSQQVICSSCKSSMSKSLSACPVCGHGAIQHRVMPGVVISSAELSKSERKARLLQPKIEQDLVLPNGFKPSDR